MEAGIKYLDLGDRATISNMTPEYGAGVTAMFAIDDRTIDYLRITGRKQVKLVETLCKSKWFMGRYFAEATYARTIKFDLSSVSRTLAGPSQPHKLLPVSALMIEELLKNEISNDVIPDGAVLIAAITSCTNTSNPRNVVAGIIKKTNELGLTRKRWVKSSLAPGSKVSEIYLKILVFR